MVWVGGCGFALSGSVGWMWICIKWFGCSGGWMWICIKWCSLGGCRFVLSGAGWVDVDLLG